MGDPNSNGTRPSYSFVSLNVIDEEIDCGHLHHKFGVSDYDSLIQEDPSRAKTYQDGCSDRRDRDAQYKHPTQDSLFTEPEEQRYSH